MTTPATQLRTRPVGLSRRLTAIVEMAGSGVCVCDVGCDHAHVPIRLLQEGRFQRAIGMDVIAGPLEKAAGNLSLYGMEDRIRLRLSDGLDAFESGEADLLVITGMGGTLMEEILRREPEKTRSFPALVLGPQSDPDKVRAALRQLGACIVDEKLVYEDGKYYPVLRAVFSHGRNGFSDGADAFRDRKPLFADRIPPGIRQEAEDRFGPVLLTERDPVLQEYLRRQTVVLEKILHSVTAAVIKESTGDPAECVGDPSGQAGSAVPDRVKEEAKLREKHLAKRDEILHDLEVFRAALTVYE